jgi:hypothetical protein
LLRGLILLVPLTASVAAGIAVSRVLSPPDGILSTVAWYVAIIVCSMATLLLVDRLARRFLPLAVLLRVSLVFPDHAPSRLAVAARAGSGRRLKTCIADAADDPDPVTVVTLAAALNAHDRRTRGHSERVRALRELAALIVRIGDNGRKLVKPRLSVVLHGPGGYTRTIARQYDTILPGDTIALPFIWPDSLAAGDYHVVIHATGGPQPIVREATLHLGTALHGATNPNPPNSSGFPLVPAVGLLLVILLAAGVLIGLLRRRRARERERRRARRHAGLRTPPARPARRSPHKAPAWLAPPSDAPNAERGPSRTNSNVPAR